MQLKALYLNRLALVAQCHCTRTTDHSAEHAASALERGWLIIRTFMDRMLYKPMHGKDSDVARITNIDITIII